MDTYTCVKCERAVLREVSGNCHTPIGVYARKEGDVISVKASVLSPDGKQTWTEQATSNSMALDDVVSIGREVGRRLKEKVPHTILDQG